VYTVVATSEWVSPFQLLQHAFETSSPCCVHRVLNCGDHHWVRRSPLFTTASACFWTSWPSCCTQGAFFIVLTTSEWGAPFNTTWACFWTSSSAWPGCRGRPCRVPPWGSPWGPGWCWDPWLPRRDPQKRSNVLGVLKKGWKLCQHILAWKKR
jgi:hypothetical protein